MRYLYGEEVEYEYNLIQPEDVTKLQAFSCDNKRLDYYIHNELIQENVVDTEDGLPFKVIDLKTDDIITVFSLAASGIIWKMDNYTHVLPAMCDVIRHCRDISENKATAKYIVLYADKKARRFYERNMFSDFSEFMEKENNMEINKNDPMYMLI